MGIFYHILSKDMVKYFGVLFFGDPLDSFCYDIACHILRKGEKREGNIIDQGKIRSGTGCFSIQI